MLADWGTTSKDRNGITTLAGGAPDGSPICKLEPWLDDVNGEEEEEEEEGTEDTICGVAAGVLIQGGATKTAGVVELQ